MNNIQVNFEDDSILKEIKAKVKSGIIKDDVIDTSLIDLTEKFALDIKEKGISNSSIRNIYDSFKNLQQRLSQEYIKKLSENLLDTKGAENEAFRKIFPMIKLMKSKTFYVLERKAQDEKNINMRKSYLALKEFISVFITNIKSKKEYDAFVDLFECIIGNLK